MYNNYPQNGVVIKPSVLAEGDNATVLYNGLLYHSGAQHVIMHTGYGDHWNGTQDIRMNRTAEGFEAAIPIASHDNLNLAFKDCASNWDNNSGRNYSFEVQDKYASSDARKKK